MIENKKASKTDAITMGNGASEAASVIGALQNRIYTKHGIELGPAKMDEVRHLPGGKFNLFSVTKLMKSGWTLGGNKEALWLKKGTNILKFDIKIETPKGIQ
jgi:hypothetical protein